MKNKMNEDRVVLFFAIFGVLFLLWCFLGHHYYVYIGRHNMKPDSGYSGSVEDIFVGKKDRSR
jgi:hypothetical protein